MSENEQAFNQDEIQSNAQPQQAEAAEAPITEPPRLTVVEGAGENAPEAGTTVQRARFAPLQQAPATAEQGSMDLLLDVRLDLSVELGRTSIPVRDVLQLGPGSIVPLEKLSGEPVDIMINDKLIARGEVVVVDESFGVRVTEMVSRSAAAAQA